VWAKVQRASDILPQRRSSHVVAPQFGGFACDVFAPVHHPRIYIFFHILFFLSLSPSCNGVRPDKVSAHPPEQPRWTDSSYPQLAVHPRHKAVENDNISGSVHWRSEYKAIFVRQNLSASYLMPSLDTTATRTTIAIVPNPTQTMKIVASTCCVPITTAAMPTDAHTRLRIWNTMAVRVMRGWSSGVPTALSMSAATVKKTPIELMITEASRDAVGTRLPLRTTETIVVQMLPAKPLCQEVSSLVVEG
jgi:hypothetical protein